MTCSESMRDAGTPAMKRYFKPARIVWSAPGQAHGLAHAAVAKRLLVAGQPGTGPEGDVPEDLAAQTAFAFDNVFAVLEAGQMKIEDIVKLVVHVAAPDGASTFDRVREVKLGALTPVVTYLQAAGFRDPRWKVLIEAEAINDAA
jgi:enamine deaminase RidA (YjgF/YER057c/UK114 family)